MMKGCWQFPNHGWIKVNVDGSVPTFKPRATIGGVVRGPSGSWMAAFEMVCLMDWEVKFRQILRESNKVADRIAKEARDEMDQLIIHEEPLGA
ncbi:hypothetical protein Gotur_021301 [Gossypium turneri]